jgi:fibronectin-binding autotransporter adhesin
MPAELHVFDRRCPPISRLDLKINTLLKLGESPMIFSVFITASHYFKRFCLAATLLLLVFPTARGATTTWTNNADSVWQIGTNWDTGVVPNGVGSSTLLGSAITADRTIRLGDNVFVGALTISNANSYKITGLYDPEFEIIALGSASLTTAGGGAHVITSTIDLVNDLVITQNSSGVLSLKGNINVNGNAVSKYGSGVLEMTGNGYFGGGLNINEGTVRVYAEPALGNGTAVTINGGTLNIGANMTADGTRTYTIGAAGGTINVDSGYTFTGATGSLLGGSGALTKSGAGTMVLSGDNSATFTGSISIVNGTVRVTAENNLGASGNDVTLNGGTLNVGGTFTNNAGKVITVTGTGTLDVDVNQTLTLGSAGQLSGSGALTKAGSGSLTLSGDNSATFTGNTTISAGTVRVTAENNLGAAANDVTLNGGTLNIGGTFTNSASKTITVQGTGSKLTIDSGSTLTMGSTSQLLGSAPVTVSGAGTLSLTGNQNAFTGNTTVSGATLSLSGSAGSATNIGSFTITDQGRLQINNGGTASLDRLGNSAAVTLNGGNIQYLDSITKTENVGILTLAGGGSTVEMSGSAGTPVLNFASLSRTANDATINFKGTGSATLNSSANISFTTAPSLVNGIIGGWATVLASTSSTTEFATMSGQNVAPLTSWERRTDNKWSATDNVKPNVSLTLNAARTINSLTLADGNNLALGGNVLTLTSGGLIVQGTSTISGTGSLTVGTGTGQSLYAHVDSGATLSDTSVLADNGSAVSLVKAGLGTMTLGGANTYTGGTYINGGTLKLTASNRIADGSALTVATGGAFDLNGFSETVGSIAGGGFIANSSGTLTEGGNNSSTIFSGLIFGGGGLTKTGSGTLTLSGVNTYSGDTTVNAGTVSVSQESNLGASANDVVLNGGTLNVSESFTANAAKVLTMTGNGTIDVNSGKTLTFTSASDLTGSGNLTKSGAGTLTLAGATGYSGNFVINAGELKVQGLQSDVDALLSSTRVGNLTGSGGTLTWDYTNPGSFTNTISVQPNAPSNIKLGFDAPTGSDIWYVLGPTNNNLNWAGLVVKGGKVNLSSDHTLVGTSSTTLEISGGDLYLAGGNPSGGKTLTVSGNVSLTGGFIDGGPGGGSHGTLVTAGNITSSGTVLVNGPNITMTPNNGITTSVGGTTPLNGVFEFVKQGGGTVRLDQSMTVSDFLQISSGTLLLGASDRLNDSATIKMQGGTFATGGFQDTVGTLTLTGSASLDLGTGNNSMLAFADTHAASWGGYTLSITNYLDSSEKIYFGTTSSGLTASQLSEIVWYNPYGTNSTFYGATIDFDGRIRPAPQAVPEPKTVMAFTLLAGVVCWRERKSLGQVLRTAGSLIRFA